MKVDWDELKRWATDRLDYEDTEIGKAHSAYGGHYFAGVLALLAEREAAQKLRYDYAELVAYLNRHNFGEITAPHERKLAAFDKETE